MDRLADRRLEERSVQIYLPLAFLSSILIIGVSQLEAPYVAIFVAFWLVALCVIAALVTAVVVLSVNAHRATTHKAVDMRATVVATTIPASLSVVLFVIFVEQSPQVTEAVLIGGLITMLIIAPVGLFVTIFGTHVHCWLRTYT